MFHFTYQTKNLINDKTYIGIHSTENINDGYLGSGLALMKAIEKYGKENFSMIPLDFFDTRDEALEEEAFLVTEETVNDRNNYNLVTGGLANRVMSDETRKRLSQSLKGRSVWNEGVQMSEETKINLSRTKTNYKIEQYSRDGILLETYDNYYEAYTSVGGSRTSLWRALSGKRKTYGGYVWKRKY